MIKKYEKELKEEIPYGSNAAQKQGLDNDVIPEPYDPPLVSTPLPPSIVDIHSFLLQPKS